MKIVVFGATGRIGGHLVNWAIDAGHEVSALVRNAGAVRPRAGLTVSQGDVLDAGTVAAVVSGADAVLSALGPRGLDGFRKTELLAPAAANIVAGMDKTGAHRLLCVSAAGAFIAGDPGTPWLVRQILPRVLARTFADVQRMEQLVTGSDLDWTLVRATRLIDDPARGQYRVRAGYPPEGGGKIARADVAGFMGAALTEGSYIRQTPALAY
jgi:putative NADH-flavin reductase